MNKLLTWMHSRFCTRPTLEAYLEVYNQGAATYYALQDALIELEALRLATSATSMQAMLDNYRDQVRELREDIAGLRAYIIELEENVI